MAASIREALENPKAKKEPAAVNFAAIKALATKPVLTFTDEQLKDEQKNIQDRRDTAQAVAAKILEVTAEIRKITAVEGFMDDPKLIQRLNQLKQLKEELGNSGDQTFKESVKVATLINGLMSANPASRSDVISWMKKIVEIGRGRIFDEQKVRRDNGDKLPDGTVVFGGDCLIHIRSEFYKEGTSPADRKIFYEFRQLISRYWEMVNKETKAKMKDAIAKGNPNLLAMAGKEIGIYVIHFSPGNGESRQSEGVALVEVKTVKSKEKEFIVVEAKEGYGSLAWVGLNAGKFIPQVAVKTGVVLEDKTPKFLLDFAKKFARMLFAATREYRKRQKSAAAK